MINKIQLQFGPKGRTEKFEIDPGSVTIFVGPNNSGKSMVLREIEAYCQNGAKGNLKILDDVQFTFPAETELLRQLATQNRDAEN